MTRTAALSALAFLSACTTASSTDIKTSGLYATITGTANGSGATEVSTTLQLGPLSTTFVELSGTDTLTATSGSNTATLKKFALLGLVNYSASLTGDEEGKSVTVALTRSGGDTSAPSSVLTLPAKFELTGPTAGATFKRGTDQIEVKWDTSGKPDTLTIDLSGSCIETVSKTATDSGSLVIAGSELKASKDNETKTCDVTVTTRRTRAGTLDAAYGKGGSVSGVQVRTRSIKSAP
ncbi:MAG: hypothetical protein H6Q89_2701 [Myxococcaceae bacterium]|nr:hypothetical protein [Myxococcaceae bacterium]